MGNPALSDNPGQSPQLFYKVDVDNTKDLIFGAKGNLYSFYLENNDPASDVFIHFYDADDVGDVTVGTTQELFSLRIPAGGAIGKDSTDTSFAWFKDGLVIAVTAARGVDGAPGADATVKLGFVARG